MYDETALGHFVKIVPIKDLRSLSISWPQLPDTRHLWDSNPLGYISHVIGHEGQNSLLSTLVKRDLVSALTAGPGSRCQQNFSSFTINATLTEKGVE